MKECKSCGITLIMKDERFGHSRKYCDKCRLKLMGKGKIVYEKKRMEQEKKKILEFKSMNADEQYKEMMRLTTDIMEDREI